MYDPKSNNTKITIAIIIITIVALSVYFYYFFEPEPKLPIKISYSLDPQTVKENAPATLNFTITNVNETSHEIQFIFNTDPRIKIYAGTEQLLSNNTYYFTLGDYERDQTRTFTLYGSLEENIASSRYKIKLQVKLDKQIIQELTKDIYLTVTTE